MAFHGMEGTIFKNSRNNLKIKLENILEQIRNREELTENEINQLRYSDLLAYYDEHSPSILFVLKQDYKINGKTVYIYSQVYRGVIKGQ